VLFLVQNNGYAISVPQSVQTGSEIHTIAKGFKVRSVEVDGTQFTKMYQTLKPLIAETRRGGGPLLVEAHVVRIDSHSSSDDQAKYRTEEELEAVRQRDPIAHSSGRVLSWGLLDEAGFKKMHEEVKTAVNQAADEADAAAMPEPETAALHIFSGRQPIDTEVIRRSRIFHNPAHVQINLHRPPAPGFRPILLPACVPSRAGKAPRRDARRCATPAPTKRS